MKIAIIGPGAMGLLYGGYLSRENEVFLLGRNESNMEQINTQGITMHENDGTIHNFSVTATTDATTIGIVDLAILFTKASASDAALTAAKPILGPNTILMTLQNGLGHEQTLSKFAEKENIIIGTTNQGSSRIDAATIRHSGLGDTNFGALIGDGARFTAVQNAFAQSGFPCNISDQVRQMIWNKLIINASSSVLSGILQMPQGYVVQNESAWEIAKKLITEICAVATADGYPFDAAAQIERLKNHLTNAPDGLTSIYTDLKNGNLTEVSVINGAVVDNAHRLSIPVPTHELIVSLVHAMEVR